MTLIEILVTLIITVMMVLVIHAFYRHWHGGMARERTVDQVQGRLREATESLNRFLLSSGVTGDSLFFDPHRALAEPWINGGHRVFTLKDGGRALIAYGNFTGKVCYLDAPVVDKRQRFFQVTDRSVVAGHSYLYLSAGSAQEVVRVSAVQADGTVGTADDLFAFYPKGSLVFPLERIRAEVEGESLVLSRQDASGKTKWARRFDPTEQEGDSTFFQVLEVLPVSGQMRYRLGFFGKLTRGELRFAERSTDQDLLIRGF